MMSRKRALTESSSDEDENVDLLMENYTCYKSSRRFCPHCREHVSVKTYKAHRRLFFNEV